MADNELLLALSNLLDKKLEPIERRTKNIELLMENDILPRLQNIESCYTTIYRRYANGIEQLEALLHSNRQGFVIPRARRSCLRSAYCPN